MGYYFDTLYCPCCEFVTGEIFLMKIHLFEKHNYEKQVKTYTTRELIENTKIEAVQEICKYE